MPEGRSRVGRDTRRRVKGSNGVAERKSLLDSKGLVEVRRNGGNPLLVFPVSNAVAEQHSLRGHSV